MADSITKDTYPMKEFMQYWLPVLIYMSGITYISSFSSPEEQFSTFALPVSDKIIHATEYAILGILSFRAFEHAAGSLGATHAFSFAVLTATVFGLSDEYHQSFVPLRQADPLDLVADCLGSIIGILIWQQVRTYYRKNTRHDGKGKY